MTNRPLADRSRFRLRYTVDSQPHWIRSLTSLDACQRVYVSLREECDLGASRFGEGEIFDQFGQYVARVSYNGRLWPALPWTPGMKPLAEAPQL